MDKHFRALWFLLFILGLPLAAQQSVGNVSGTVQDSTQAVIPGAKVHLTDPQTGLIKDVETNAKGEYSIFGLPVATYSVTFAKDGFKTEVHSQTVVNAGATTTLSVNLQPGTAATEVTVSASPLLDRNDAANGYVLTSDTIDSIPLGTGSFTQLAVMSPGVSADLLQNSSTNSGLGNQPIWANGQRDTSNSFSFNGVNSQNLFNGKSSSSVSEAAFLPNTGEHFLTGGQIQTNTSVYDAIGQGLPTPPPESISQIQVDSSMYDASEGANSGAHIEVVTKSGTNDLHGMLYSYVQSNIFNAAPFFYNASTAIPQGQKVPELSRNVYGGTLGGPLIKNKLMYFISYQGLIDHDQLSGTSKLNVPLALTNDRSAATLETEFGVSHIDPVALNLLNAKVNGQFVIPTPAITTAAAASSAGYDAIQTGTPSFDSNQLNYNLDYLRSANDRWSMKYYFQNDPTTSPFAISSLEGFPQQLQAGSQVVSFEDSRILSPTLTWQQSLGFIRQTAYASVRQQITPAEEGMNLFGENLFPAISITAADPTLKKSLSFGTGGNFSNGGVFQNQLSYNTTLDWVRSNHTVQMGFNYGYNQLNIVNNATNAASLKYSTWNNFLQGIQQSGSVLIGEANRYYRAGQAGAFLQDNWHVSPGINLLYGVRWDWDGPLSEEHGLLTNFDPSLYQYNAQTDTVVNDGLVVAGNNSQFATPGTSDSTLTGRQWGFAPRLGVTWSPGFSKNLVLRAGVGMYYDRGEFFTEFSPGAGSGISGPLGVTQELPYVQLFHSPTTANLDNPLGPTAPPVVPGNPAVFAATIPNLTATAGCTAGNIPGPLGCGSGNLAPNTSSGGSIPAQIGGYAQGNTLPYSENFSFSLQWQPVNNVALTLGYTGNHGVHELLPIPINQPQIATPQNPVNGQIYSYGFNPCVLTDSVCGVDGPSTPKKANPGLLTEPFSNFNSSFDGGNVDLRVPFVGYSPNLAIWEAEGISNYNSLQFSLQKRMSRGLLLNASYTWSHTLDEGSGLGLFYNGNNPLDPRQAYGTADFDRPNVVAFSYIWDLPKPVNQNNSAMGQALNGWELSGITTLQSGLPYSVWDFSGGSASTFYSSNDVITNPLVPLASGQTLTSAQQLINGLPGLNAGAFAPSLLQPGQGGVPPCGPTGDGSSQSLCDTVESNYGAAGRNIFRAPFQRNFNISLAKTFKVSEKMSLKYQLDVLNLFNTPVFDAPDNDSELNGGFTDFPTTTVNGVKQPGFAQSTSFGQVTNTVGGPRYMQMSLHLSF